MDAEGAPLRRRPAVAWPDAIWDATMLRGLDARARREIAAAGSALDLRAGEVLYRYGDPADALYVVASGVCVIRGVRRGEIDPAVIRRVEKGDVLGEEAIVAPFSTRQLEARCEADAVVAEVPLVVLKRAIGRAGGADLMARVERAMRRAATLDLLRTTSFTRTLPDSDLEVLLDAARHVHVARGEPVYREGEVSSDAFMIADGLLQVQTSDAGRPRVEAYLARGDLFGDEELAERGPRATSVVASGPTWLVAIPREVFVVVARRYRDRLEAARRLRSGMTVQSRISPDVRTTAHVFRDLYRMRVARSLLVIDQDACLRCGHCAWSCAEVHEDGVSRLVRRGDKIFDGDRADGLHRNDGTAALLVPNSCQHCKNPSCMIGCPTGAIGRDARGEVFIRESLCTGCGSCAKSCPWENIQMAPRRDTTEYPTIAVKCDLCNGVEGGPACVSSCPTQAIARIDPSEAIIAPRQMRRQASDDGHAVERAAELPILPPRAPAWPWILGAGLAASGFAELSVSRWTSGILAGALFLLLVGYAVGKRSRGALSTFRRKVPLARWLFVAHLSIGVLASGVIRWHVRGEMPPSVGGALAFVVSLAIVTGGFGAAIGAVAPRALSRVERRSLLPEELAARSKDLDEELFRTLSGKSELTKLVFTNVLGPYRRSVAGPLVLILSRRSLRAEEDRLRARIGALLERRAPEGGLSHAPGGRDAAAALAGVDDLVRLVVEHRAVRAQRALTWALRGWLAPHVAAAAAAVVLLVAHVVTVSWSGLPTAPASPRPRAERAP